MGISTKLTNHVRGQQLSEDMAMTADNDDDCVILLKFEENLDLCGSNIAHLGQGEGDRSLIKRQELDQDTSVNGSSVQLQSSSTTRYTSKLTTLKPTRQNEKEIPKSDQYCCLSCGLKVTSMDSLNAHYRDKHGIKDIPPETIRGEALPQPIPEMGGKYVCVVCYSNFITLAGLECHMGRMHRGSIIPSDVTMDSNDSNSDVVILDEVVAKEQTEGDVSEINSDISRYRCPMCSHVVNSIKCFWNHYQRAHDIHINQLPPERVIRAGFVVRRRMKKVNFDKPSIKSYCPSGPTNYYSQGFLKQHVIKKQHTQYINNETRCSTSTNLNLKIGLPSPAPTVSDSDHNIVEGYPSHHETTVTNKAQMKTKSISQSDLLSPYDGHITSNSEQALNNDAQQCHPHHLPQVLIYCNECLESFDSEAALQTHKLVHNPTTQKKQWPFYCHYCKNCRNFKWNSQMRGHIALHKDDNPPYPCEYCTCISKSELLLRFHKLSHTNFWGALTNCSKNQLEREICYSSVTVIQCPFPSCKYLAPFTKLENFEDHFKSIIHSNLDYVDNPEEVMISQEIGIKFEAEDVEVFEGMM